MKKSTNIAICVVILFSLSSVAYTQKKNNRRPTAQPGPTPQNTAPQVTTTDEPDRLPVVEATPPKRNVRPDNGMRNGKPAADHKTGAPNYFYEFDRPGFTYGRVSIEHDELGRGKISFLKENYTEPISDPIELSAPTISKLKQIFDELNFLSSTENYQHERDFTNMGNVTITLKRDGLSRTVKYNWTDNKLAKALMDEYRRISNEYTWRFEVSSAIENQPLQLPGLMETMDRYITQKEISDPQHILPLLTDLSNNERLPLMARNRAAKIVKKVGKASK